MKHLNKEDFLYRMGVIGMSKVNYGITVCSVLKNFINDLVNDGFKVAEIVTILNFILYECDIDYKIKYHHVYYFIKRNKIKGIENDK